MTIICVQTIATMTVAQFQGQQSGKPDAAYNARTAPNPLVSCLLRLCTPAFSFLLYCLGLFPSVLIKKILSYLYIYPNDSLHVLLLYPIGGCNAITSGTTVP